MSHSANATPDQGRLITPVLIAGCIVVLLSFSVRASFGVFQLPIATEFHWPRAEFSFAIAIQNLFWGIGQPIFSALAEKFGDRKAILAGATCYAIGLILSSYAVTPGQHQLLEMLVGFGIAGTGFGVILAVVGRATSDKHRSMAMGIATAAGSAGQIVGPPLAEFLLRQMPWQSVFIVFAAMIMAGMLSLFLMRSPSRLPTTTDASADEGLGRILGQAMRDPSYIAIFAGFFSCGYQLGFITAHFPAFVTEMCGPVSPGSLIHDLGITTTAALGAAAIALVGFANICGTLTAGWLGDRFSRKYLLSAIYTGRTIIAAWFILTPMTPGTVIVFSILMGALWLATVPLTSGLIAHIYGLRYMGTLYGFVFFSHQLGGFMGVWLGGTMFDRFGDYNLVWWVGIGVGIFSAVVHLPVREQPRAAQPA